MVNPKGLTYVPQLQRFQRSCVSTVTEFHSKPGIVLDSPEQIKDQSGGWEMAGKNH
jgi:hypothetical protein